MNHKRTDHEIICAVIVMLIAAIVCLFLWGGPDDADAKQPTIDGGATLCFPAELWSAPNPGRRACLGTRYVHEDGSAWLTLGTARRAIARCAVPSVFEEPRRFTIKCWRISR